MSSSSAPAAVEPTRVHAALSRWAAAGAARLAGLPLWASALLIWALARAWSALLLLIVDRQAPDGPWGETPLGYLGTVGIWDGTWYERIHDGGYPSEIPRNEDGTAQANQWAFYPVFPLLVRAVTGLTGLGWPLASATVALLGGFAAAVAIAHLFRRMVSERTALWAVAFVAFCGVSPVLQVSYAESLHLALLAAALILVLDRRALLAAPVILVMCLTRPAGVPFAAALGITWCVRACWELRDGGLDRPLRVLDRWFWLALWSCFCALLWPLLAWWATGEPRAYTDTETAWRGTGLVPLQPWFELGGRFLGEGWGWLLVVVLAVAFALVMTTRVVREVLPLGVRIWAMSYGVYLLLFLHPQSSTLRLLLPLFVLAAPLAGLSESRAYRWTLVLVGALTQIVWIGVLWQWSPLPQGGDYPP